MTSNFSRWQPWFIWSLVALFYGYEFLHRLSPSVMIPELMQAFQTNAQNFGQLSAAYYYAYALMQIPAGILLDKYPVPKVLTAALALVTLGSLLQTTGQSLTWMLIARALMGIGSAFAFIGAIKVGLSWFGQKVLPIIVGLTNAIGVSSSMLTALLAIGLSLMPWRSVLTLVTLVGVVLTLIMMRHLSLGPHLLKSQQPPPAIRDLLKTVANHRATWLFGAYSALIVAPIAGLAELWLVPFLSEAYQLTRPHAAMLNGIIFVGIATGGPTIGWLFSRSTHPRLLFASCVAMAGTTLTLLIYCPNTPFWFFVPLLFLYGFFSAHMLLSFTIISKTFSHAVSGTAIAFVNMMIMGMAALTQPVIGALLDNQHHHLLSTLDYQHAFIILPLGLVFAGILIFFLPFPSRSQS